MRKFYVHNDKRFCQRCGGEHIKTELKPVAFAFTYKTIKDGSKRKKITEKILVCGICIKPDDIK